MNHTIRARIHDSAVRRVTRIYASTLSDVFLEALHDSRRGGAARVRISIAALNEDQAAGAAGTGETPLTVTVADDGMGIADPAVLLSFGENGWDGGLGPARGRRRLRLRQPVAPRLRRLIAAPFPGRADHARMDGGPGAQALFSGKPRPRSARKTPLRSRTGPRFRSGRPSLPPRSATRRRTPPAIIPCP